MLGVERSPGRGGWPRWAAARTAGGPPGTTASTGIIPSVNLEANIKKVSVENYFNISQGIKLYGCCYCLPCKHLRKLTWDVEEIW